MALGYKGPQTNADGDGATLPGSTFCVIERTPTLFYSENFTKLLAEQNSWSSYNIRLL